MNELDSKSVPQVPVVNAGQITRRPSVQIRPSRGMFHLDLRSVWQYRELLVFLVWRDTKVRYKQAVIGAGWAVFQPLISMLLFTAIFQLWPSCRRTACRTPSLPMPACSLGISSRSDQPQRNQFGWRITSHQQSVFPAIDYTVGGGLSPGGRFALCVRDDDSTHVMVWHDARMANSLVPHICHHRLTRRLGSQLVVFRATREVSRRGPYHPVLCAVLDVRLAGGLSRQPDP